MQYYVVQDVHTGEILPGMPSIRLTSVGRAQSYYHDGIWYMKDKGYESSDRKYTSVRVIRNPEFKDYPYG